MHVFTATVTMMALVAATLTEAQTINITRAGGRPVQPGPSENFTGTARVEMLFAALDPSHASGGFVTFESGARTARHSHPRGQILIVTAGTGRVQVWGERVEEIRTGDVARIPAGQKSASAREILGRASARPRRSGRSGRERGHWHVRRLSCP